MKDETAEDIRDALVSIARACEKSADNSNSIVMIQFANHVMNKTQHHDCARCWVCTRAAKLGIVPDTMSAHMRVSVSNAFGANVLFNIQNLGDRAHVVIVPGDSWTRETLDANYPSNPLGIKA